MNAFDKIIPAISKTAGSIGSHIITGNIQLPLNRELFRLIVPGISSRMLFVDSGSGEVLKGASVSLVFMRLYAAFYENNIRAKSFLKEVFVLVSAASKDLFQVKVFGLEGTELSNISFNAFDPSVCAYGRRAEPGSIINSMRKILEFDFCAELCSNLKQIDVIVRDGDLEASDYVQASLNKLVSLAKEKSVCILGIAKTSSLYTDSGASAIAALHSICPPGPWVFGDSSTVFAKFHPKSKYIFRCDVIGSLGNVFAALVSNSIDPAFLGYPYGLLDADKFAQVTKQETSQLRARFAVQSREQFATLESALNAHDILDIL